MSTLAPGRRSQPAAVSPRVAIALCTVGLAAIFIVGAFGLGYLCGVMGLS